jgi:DNA-binding response OmpR family regulator
MRRKKLLIVDDEESIVLSLFRELFRDNDRLDVLVAHNGEIAQQILRENGIEVMLTDIRLPGMSGLDLICWASTESPETATIIMTAYEVDALRDHACRFGCLQIVQKPFDLHAMRKRLTAACVHRDGVGGSLADLSPADVIQMLCLSQKSAALRVADGDDWGVVHLEHGEIIHAVWNDEVGEPAFYRVLRARRGIFNTLPVPAAGPRTIHADWRHLLIEGMRLEDEQQRDGPSDLDIDLALSEPAEVPAPAGPAEQWQAAVERSRTTPGSDAEVARLVDQGFRRLRERDFAGARALWLQAQALAPDNRMLALNLRRLDKLAGG